MLTKRHFLKLLGLFPLALSTRSNASEVKSTPPDEAAFDPKPKIDFAWLTIPVRVVEPRYYFFPKGKKQGDLPEEDGEELQVDCIAKDINGKEIPTLLYVAGDDIAQARLDFVPGSCWLVTGGVAFFEDGMTIYGPLYEKQTLEAF